MSSRLLTMKFMQRAAHSPTTPTSPDEPSAKRRKTDSPSQGARFNVDTLADRSAIQAAIASEDAKREAALEKQAAEAGDTRWVLNFENQKNLSASPSLVLRVISTGFAHLDAPSPVKHVEDSDEDKPAVVGRRSFGRFNKVIEKQQDPTLESDSESDEDVKEESEDSESDDEFDPTTQMIKAERRQAAERAKNELKAKKRAAKIESEQLAKKRRKDNPGVNLNKLTTLSGTNQSRPAAKPPAGMKCFNCGGDHFKKDCPNGAKRGFPGGNDGPPRKAPKYK